MAIDKLKTTSLEDNSITSDKIASGAVTISDIGDNEISMAKLSQVDLTIAPEVLEIQVDAPDMGQDTMWKWTWEQSTLPYARRTITNSNELNVPLYKEGTYVVNNFAAYDIHGSMTQTHSLYLKWIDGAGTDNLISWATSAGPISDTHPDINGGNATDVQRITVNVPATITIPSLTNPSVSYTVVNNASGGYTFSGSAKGDNPNLGPFYRGGTYTVNINATGHPFYFTTDNGTNFSSGTYFGEYTSGVTGSRTDSGTITFTVPANAPDTLYYQCGNHSAMRGAITVKDLAVETNINGNYVVYFQHTQEGHRTPVELRPIPSLVNQMCLVYDNNTNKFVPQDLATYVENTPSFENKIREVAGTAELVVEDGSAVIAKVNVYDDSTYLPLTGNNPGDQAFATDTDILYIWDGSAWQQAGAANSDDLTEGSTNLFFTDARADARIAAATTTDLTEGTNLYYTDARADARAALLVDSAPATLDTLNELAAALGDDPNFATTVTNSIATKLPLAGGTLTGNVNFGNNDKAIFGTGSSLEIYGDGSASYISENGTGSLNIVANGPQVLIKTAGDETMAKFINNGNVVLYSNNVERVRTNGTGIDVTGTVNADGLTVDGAASIGSSTAKTKFYSDSTYNGIYNGANLYANESIYMGAGNMYFYTAADQRMLMASNGDISFYEDTGTTAKFFWDASTESLGIGTTSPSSLLELRKTTAGLITSGSGNTGPVLTLHHEAQWENGYSGGDWLGAIDFSTGDASVGEGVRASIRTTVNNYYNTHALAFYTANQGDTTLDERMRIKENGNVGIGTDNPEKTLHVKYDGSGGVKFESTQWNIVDINSDSDDNGSNDDTILRFTNGSNNAVRGEIRFDESSNTFELGHGDNQNHIAIASNGNVGIGTDAPVAQYGNDKVLEIQGSVSPGFVIADTGQGQKYGWHADSTAMRFTYGSNTLVKIDGSATDSLYITNQRHVGVGRNPETMHPNVTNSLNVGTTSIFQRGTNNGYLGSNMYYEPGGDVGYSIGSGYGLLYQQNVPNGDHIFSSSTAAASTGANGLSFSENMRITGDGKVGINNGDPQGALSIHGTTGTSYSEVQNLNGVNFYKFFKVIDTARSLQMENIFIMPNLNNGQQYIHFVTTMQGAMGFDLDILCGRSGSERMFGRVSLRGFKYHESDGDYRHGAIESASSINAYGNYFEINGPITQYLADSANATQESYSNPGNYWVTRIPCNFAGGGSGQVEFTAFLKTMHHNTSPGGTYYMGIV